MVFCGSWKACQVTPAGLWTGAVSLVYGPLEFNSIALGVIGCLCEFIQEVQEGLGLANKQAVVLEEFDGGYRTRLIR